MEAEQRRSIRERWIYALFGFAHIEYQKKLWIQAEYIGFVGDSNDAFCDYFDSLDLDNGYDSFLKESILTQQEVDIVIEFHFLLEAYLNKPEKRTLSDKNILRDNEWIALAKLAKESWDNLKIVITDKRELEYMNSLETKFLK